MTRVSRKIFSIILSPVIIIAAAITSYFIIRGNKPSDKPVDISGISVIWPESTISARIKFVSGGKTTSYCETMRARTFLMRKENNLQKVFREILTTKVSDNTQTGEENSRNLLPGPSYLVKLYDSRWRNRARFAGKAGVFDLVRAATGDSCVLPPRPVLIGESWTEKIGYGDFSGEYTYTYLGNSGKNVENIRCIGTYRNLEDKSEIGTISVTTVISRSENAAENRIEGVFHFHPEGLDYTEHFIESGRVSRGFPVIDSNLEKQVNMLVKASEFFRQNNLESAAKILENYLAVYPEGLFKEGAGLLLKKIFRETHR